MRTVNIHEAKTQFSKLVEAVGHGEKIIIVKAGKPAAMLVPVQAKRTVRRPGSMKGKISVADDFDAPLPEDIQAAFDRN